MLRIKRTHFIDKGHFFICRSGHEISEEGARIPDRPSALALVLKVKAKTLETTSFKSKSVAVVRSCQKKCAHMLLTCARARAHVSECVYVNEITCEIHYSTVPEI